jgi:hypothetical protein
MPSRRVNAPEPEPSRRRAASTPEARENQLVNLAVDLAERQHIDGTASAQVISHYLRAGSTREYLEKQRLAMDVELMEAKKKAMAQGDRMEMLVQHAIDAMRGYQGQPPLEGGEDFDH